MKPPKNIDKLNGYTFTLRHSQGLHTHNQFQLTLSVTEVLSIPHTAMWITPVAYRWRNRVLAVIDWDNQTIALRSCEPGEGVNGTTITELRFVHIDMASITHFIDYLSRILSAHRSTLDSDSSGVIHKP